ncbi:MAG TPA: group 1 glycosyl transferase [Cyanothece sp. UBA12306]|nr:group 1 glycosyl transferase [Cyanothece sp. UBA12306]
MKSFPLGVVIVAEHASTQYGGEAFLPLSYFLGLRSRQIDAWLVVHSRTKDELQNLFPQEKERIIFIEDTGLHQLLWRMQRLLPTKVGEVTFSLVSKMFTQLIQRDVVCQLISQYEINVIHQAIPVAPRYPSLIFGLDKPVIIGPLNGNINFPPAFRASQNYLSSLVISLGRFFSEFVHQILPGKLKAQVLLVANERTRQALPKKVQGKIIKLVENAVDLSLWQPIAHKTTEAKETVKFVFMGRLVKWKGVDLLLEAFSLVRTQVIAQLQIIGDGDCKQQLEARAVRLGLANQVVFSGWLSQSQCILMLHSADILVHPSLRECGGAVVLEAMAVGLPVIVTDWGGPAEYVNSFCGFLIKPSSRKDLVGGFAQAMLKLAKDSRLRQKMGRAGQERVRRFFSREVQIDQLIKIYQWAATNSC